MINNKSIMLLLGSPKNYLVRKYFNVIIIM